MIKKLLILLVLLASCGFDYNPELYIRPSDVKVEAVVGQVFYVPVCISRWPQTPIYIYAYSENPDIASFYPTNMEDALIEFSKKTDLCNYVKVSANAVGNTKLFFMFNDMEVYVNVNIL